MVNTRDSSLLLSFKYDFFMRALFPEININHAHRLDVGDGHVLYVEESGNPNGIPVVYCHGGPGGGSAPFFRRFYDPQKYRIILFDQRGCGQSTPHCAEDINAIWNNTTDKLVQDLESIRQFLDIDKWVVAGGSWGTTLALMYAIGYPHRVSGLILRGIFLARQQDIDWLFGDKGAAQLFPEYYRKFITGHEFTDVEELLESYMSALSGDNDLEQLAAAKQFAHWEGKICKLKPDSKINISNKEAIAMALLNCHYFTQHSFIYEGEIVSNLQNIANIPGYIIHGRYDVVCKAEGAVTLAEYWPNGALEIVPDAGHSCTEPGVIDGLVRASIKMAEFIEKQ